MTLKLYTVVRRDLPLGVQAAQSAHAVAAFALRHPKEFKEWDNKTIVLLKDTKEKPLDKIIESAKDGAFTHALFFESDHRSLGIDSFSWANHFSWVAGREKLLTSAAFAPNWLVQNVLLADLPLVSIPDTVFTGDGSHTDSARIARKQRDMFGRFK